MYNEKSNLGDEFRDLKQSNLNLMDKLEKCGSKISSATKFIDFFVHDILDYTLLNEKETNFMANNTMFNI